MLRNGFPIQSQNLSLFANWLISDLNMVWCCTHAEALFFGLIILLSLSVIFISFIFFCINMLIIFAEVMLLASQVLVLALLYFVIRYLLGSVCACSCQIQVSKYLICQLCYLHLMFFVLHFFFLTSVRESIMWAVWGIITWMTLRCQLFLLNNS